MPIASGSTVTASHLSTTTLTRSPTHLHRVLAILAFCATSQLRLLHRAGLQQQQQQQSNQEINVRFGSNGDSNALLMDDSKRPVVYSFAHDSSSMNSSWEKFHGSNSTQVGTISKINNNQTDGSTVHRNPTNDTVYKHLLVNESIVKFEDWMNLDDGIENSFSACLLVMDDNHRLDEWIAYHYLTMSLRYVVVAVDPHSRTSPTKLLDRWRQRGLIILEWIDQDFITNRRSRLLRDFTDDPYVKREKHKERQASFYQACTRYLRQQNRTWTTYHDIDEFISINTEVIHDGQARLKEPGSIPRLLHELRYNTSYHHIPHVSHFHADKCITLPRALYSAVESSPEQIQHNVSLFINPRQFDTLRWRYRGSERGVRDGLAKSIMDVSKVTNSDLSSGGNAHRPAVAVCPNIRSDYILPIGIHHYLGSFESYAFRDDARKGTLRSHEVWLERATKQAGGPDDEVRGWIEGFVDYVGPEQARYLLSHAGLPPDYRMSENATMAWASIFHNKASPSTDSTFHASRGRNKRFRRKKVTRTKQ